MRIGVLGAVLQVNGDFVDRLIPTVLVLVVERNDVHDQTALERDALAELAKYLLTDSVALVHVAFDDDELLEHLHFFLYLFSRHVLLDFV